MEINSKQIKSENAKGGNPLWISSSQGWAFRLIDAADAIAATEVRLMTEQKSDDSQNFTRSKLACRESEQSWLKRAQDTYRSCKEVISINAIGAEKRLEDLLIVLVHELEKANGSVSTGAISAEDFAAEINAE
jgi:hypothetical protein